MSGDWPVMRLDQVAEVRLGRQRSPKNHDGANMVPYLRAANIKATGLALGDVKSMHFSATEQVVFKLQPGDVLVSEASGSPGEVGKSAVWANELPSPVCFQNTLLRLRCGTSLSPEYVQMALESARLRGVFAEASRGVGMAHLTSKGLASFSFRVPPVAVQQKRVARAREQLRAVQRSAQALHRLDHLVRIAEEALLRQALVPVRVADVADLGKAVLPQGWSWVSLGDIAEVVGGVTKDVKKQQDNWPDVPYLRVANVQRGRLDLSEVTLIKVPAARAEALALQPGDVLMNEGGDRDKLGRGWVWEGQIPGCIHQNHVFRVRIKQGSLRPHLLSWYGNTWGRLWFDREGTQTTNLASISRSKLLRLPVAVPPQSEQVSINVRLDDQLAMLHLAAKSLRLLHAQNTKLRSVIYARALAAEAALEDHS